ncbi:MAG: RNA recognition motif domain-containing protein [Parachlamydiaceae bacterium]
MKLFVSNIEFNTSEKQLKESFEDFGVVDSIKLINDKESGKFRGFGFVEMADSDAKRAIKGLDGTDFKGRPLRVNEAQEKQPK